MGKSLEAFLCIRESGEIERYAATSIGSIIEKKENSYDQFESIINQGLYSFRSDNEKYEII